MRILAIEPFFGGSHQAFLAGWQRGSRHEFTVIGLPPYKWKWRMRHAAVTVASQLRAEPPRRQPWDMLWCSDMLNLAEFRGLVAPAIGSLPGLVYFHENQLTYPVQHPNERDLHYAFSNFTTALAADSVWFNSQFHLDDFLSSLQRYLSRMPDFAPLAELDSIRGKSIVQHPGVDAFPRRSQRLPGPLRILWNGRWEHDKNPHDFFAALRCVKDQGVNFQLDVLGESFRHAPKVFAAARAEFPTEIQNWGYVESVEEYRRLLGQADIVVSTAHHEFFGIGIVEAIAAGAAPLLPNRLAYPELLRTMNLDATHHLYDGTVEHLIRRMIQMATAVEEISWNESVSQLQQAATVFSWPRRAKEMDEHLASIVDIG